MRDRLIELLLGCVTFTDTYKLYAREQAEYVADHLLANGVIVPPVKVGQTMYAVLREYGENGEDVIEEWEVRGVSLFDGQWYAVDRDATEYEIGGEYCLLTREEAERALKGADK